MAEPQYIFDHTNRAEDALVFRFKHPKIQALVNLSAEEVQEIEDCLWALITERYLSTASGAQLDQWGDLVGEPRDGLTDGEYRGFIQARISTNISAGEIDRMLGILQIIGNAVSGTVRYMPLYPACMAYDYVSETVSSDAARARIYKQMLEAAPAGVCIDYIAEAPVEYFGFDDDPDALGFDEGSWAEVI